MTQWITDAKGNRCSVEYWGSEKEAQMALNSLVRCTGCTDCFWSVGCSDCTRLTGCRNCTSCVRCSGCQDCFGCTASFQCSDSAGCSFCACCSGCKACSGCCGCTDCVGSTGLHGEVDEDGVKRDPLIVPSIPNIHQTVFAYASQPFALDMADVHRCKTTHCRAGWATTLAGQPGANLENLFGWEFAATLIYEASGFVINPFRFYDSDQAAMADMQRLAEAGR